jgi:transcriptional regulator with XRE-family HTH domain
VGRRLREQRKKAGITLEQVSKILGITYQQVQKYESGHSRIPIDKLYDFSVLFGATMQYFFEGVNSLELYSKTAYGEELIPKKKNLHLNIFVLDDNPADEFVIRKAIYEIDKGICVFCVQNEGNVMHCLKRKDDASVVPEPDLIFMDISISKHNYHLLISEIKKEKNIQDIPLIILTHSVMVEDLLRVYKSGASSFICKSVDFETFKNDLRICIEYWSNVVVLPTLVKKRITIDRTEK